MARSFLVGLALVLLLTACGDSELAMSEYGERLNGIVNTYGDDAEAAWVEFVAVGVAVRAWEGVQRCVVPEASVSAV